MSTGVVPLSKLKIVVVGHVDHGKSTIVGRVIYETGSLPDGKYEAIRAMSERRGMPFEWAFLMDALQAERDQAITIDTTQIHFRTKAREYVLIDAPGHTEFLKNMVTGAASADAALIAVDAAAGVEEQTRRHAYLLHLLGMRNVVGIVNKMDLVDYSHDRFEKVRADLIAHLTALGLDAANIEVIPVSARQGDNIAEPSDKMAWHSGPTLLAALDDLPQPVESEDLPLRFPIQDVYKFDERRILAGRIESGRLRVGDTILFSPGDNVGKVASIEAWSNEPPHAAETGRSVGITLENQAFVERGQTASHQQSPPMLTNGFRSRLFWLGRQPLSAGKTYLLKMLTNQFEVRVEAIEKVINTGDLSSKPTDVVNRNEVGEVVLRTRATVPVDPFTINPRTGRFVLIENYQIVGGGIVDMAGFADLRRRESVKSTNITRVEPRVSLAERWNANGHRSGILWLTGLSGSGKTTLALELEKNLFRKGFQVAVLDGDNLRHGLNRDLGFGVADRTENIRRAGEVAALLARAGVITITAFISPYRADRDRIRELHPDLFHECHLAATAAECEQRDPKGLYAKARAGLIPEFTGVTAPYEAPTAPELTLQTGREDVTRSLDALIAYVTQVFSFNDRKAP